ncbi:MAG: HlyD family secretion protein [bacterium]
MENNTQPPSPAQKNDRKNGVRKAMFILLGILAVIGLIFGTQWFIFRLRYTTTDDAQVNGDLLPISSKVAGRITGIYVSEGDVVRRGQLLAQIDPADYRLALIRAKAGLESTEQELKKAEAMYALVSARTRIGILQSKSGVDQADSSVAISSTQREVNRTRLQSDLERAEINLRHAEERWNELKAMAEQAQTDLERIETLYKSGVSSKAQFEQAQTNASVTAQRLAQAETEKTDAVKKVEVAESNLKTAEIDTSQEDIARRNREKADLTLELSRKGQEDVHAAENAIQALRARIKDAKAAVEQAEIALRETRIVSPVDGIVARKISLPAEIVPVGKPICFVLDTSSLWITANIEETKLRKINIGSKARITIDALPGKTYRGAVKTIGAAANSKFSLIPQSNPSGQFIKVTQRIPVKIQLFGDVSSLKPGMNAVVAIKNSD